MNALIVTGGSVDDAFAVDYIQNQQFGLKIAADSGMHFYYRNGIHPDMVIGDFDSADPEVLSFYEKDPSVVVERLNPIKDDTDTEHSIRAAIAHGAAAITILGATGTRIDHILGNISLLGIGLETGTEIAITDAHNRIRLVDHTLVIPKEEQFGRFVSLVPYAGDVTGVTLLGMKYPLENYTMGGFNSLGISNEILAETGEIRLKSGYLLVIESRD